MRKAFIIEFETMDDLAEQIAAITKGIKDEKAKEIVPSETGEVNGKVFERMMAERGYKVVNSRTKERKCNEYGIRRRKVGKEWRYKYDDVIRRVPQRR